jgi:hypothetical protein
MSKDQIGKTSPYAQAVSQPGQLWQNDNNWQGDLRSKYDYQTWPEAIRNKEAEIEAVKNHDRQTNKILTALTALQNDGSVTKLLDRFLDQFCPAVARDSARAELIAILVAQRLTGG